MLNSSLVSGDIDDVIMVGGCSYIPRVKVILKYVYLPERQYLQRCESSGGSRGAVISGIQDPSGSLDILSLPATGPAVGVRANGNKFIPVIPRNTTFPAQKDIFSTTVHDNQKEALIVVYEGEGESVEDNHLLGYFKISGIPPYPKGVPEIYVCMLIHASNALRVSATVLMPGSKIPVAPVVVMMMPTVDDGHGWCGQALNVKFGSALDLATPQNKKRFVTNLE